MGLDVRKPHLMVSDQVILKPSLLSFRDKAIAEVNTDGPAMA